MVLLVGQKVQVLTWARDSVSAVAKKWLKDQFVAYASKAITAVVGQLLALWDRRKGTLVNFGSVDVALGSGCELVDIFYDPRTGETRQVSQRLKLCRTAPAAADASAQPYGNWQRLAA
jgi:hypothetical protein